MKMTIKELVKSGIFQPHNYIINDRIYKVLIHMQQKMCEDICSLEIFIDTTDHISKTISNNV